MTSWVVPLKQHNTQSRITLEILKQCSLNVHQICTSQKENNDSYAAGSV